MLAATFFLSHICQTVYMAQKVGQNDPFFENDICGNLSQISTTCTLVYLVIYLLLICSLIAILFNYLSFSLFIIFIYRLLFIRYSLLIRR